MKQTSNKNRTVKTMYAYAPVAISCILCIIVLYAGWLTKFEYLVHANESALTQTRYPSNVILVEIDHVSLKALKGWPWPRRHYAKVIDRLLDAKARNIFLDIDFSEASDPKDDDILASTLARAPPGSILMPAFLQYSNSGENKYLTLNEPNSKFSPYVTSVSVNLKPDEDGLVRRIKLLSTFADKTLPTAAIVLNHYPARMDEVARLNFRISPDSFKRISFSKIYSGDFDPDTIKNKFIIIGASALELGDRIAVPVYKSISGPTLQAMSIQTLASGTIRTSGKSTTALILILMCYPALLLFYAAGWRKGLWRLIVTSVLILSASLVLHAALNTLVIVTPILLFVILSYTFFLFSKIDRQFYKLVAQSISLRNKETLMSHVIKNTSEGIILLDNELNISTANAAACRVFRTACSNLIGQAIHRLLPDVDFTNVSNNGESRIETSAVNRDGKTLPVEITLNKVQTNDNQIYTIFIHDISERKQQQEILTYQVNHDSLTGLYNRAYLLRKINAALDDYTNKEQHAILIAIDLNNFKSINDTLGHSTGDKLLITLGQRFRTLLGEGTCVARLGGDEFGILTQWHGSADNLYTYINMIQELISNPIELGGMSLTIDAAIGVAFIPEHAKTTNEIMSAADVAMYKSKHNQREFYIYDPETDYHTKRNLTISNDIKQAIILNQLVMEYQPKIDLKSQQATSFEGLIRWHHPELGVISPDEFIPIVENSSLIKSLTMFTVETVVRKQKELKKAGFDVSISVNISAKLLDDSSLSYNINNILSAYDVSPESIILEITESAAMSEHQQTLGILNKLIKNDLKLSIDDFGTSNASFAYLKQLPAKELKIDKLFITRICHDTSDKIITASIISLAHGLNMQVVAEGVEDQESYEYLRELGCDFAQGFWISHPIPDNEVIAWLKQWNITNHVRERLLELKSISSSG